MGSRLEGCRLLVMMLVVVVMVWVVCIGFFISRVKLLLFIWVVVFMLCVIECRCELVSIRVWLVVLWLCLCLNVLWLSRLIRSRVLWWL